ncbi:5,10-methylenetetrahydromethanopterin reductase, partial [Halapricum sp. CBA1109]|uniref:5,10-methylenetetrahydromethanopterin reductase n=1 Tax=Halapricum sp. CBA1109 TaxID=2668068 RepID=UPI0012FC0397
MYGLELTPEHPVGTLADFAATAESAGLDAAFVSHHYNNRDQFMALTEMASRTDDIALGPGIANPYETHPVTLASRMATLQEVSGGRGRFGIGPGDASTLANLGFDQDDALRRTLETFKVAQELWAGERVDHDGTFRADDAGLNYEVESIPVYVGAQGPHMTRMAAKHADGVLYNGVHPRDVEWAADQVAKGLEERPDHRGEFDFAAYGSVSVAEDADAAREA